MRFLSILEKNLSIVSKVPFFTLTESENSFASTQFLKKLSYCVFLHFFIYKNSFFFLQINTSFLSTIEEKNI